MVIENLQITPLGQWLLGDGWYHGWLWSPVGVAVLLTLLIGGGFALLTILRRGAGRPGPLLSMWVGGILAAVTLVLLAALIMCSTAITRYQLNTYVAAPIFNQLAPMLGQETEQGGDQGQANDNAKDPQGKDAAKAKPPEVIGNWTSGALYTWIGATFGFFGVVYFCSWLACILHSGPARGTQACGRAVLEIIGDIARISPRRTFALAGLAFRESIRRRVVVVFVVFVVMILGAALFMKSDSAHPGQLYITVVLSATVFLTMLFALILSALSLPGDIRDRTLTTVVTKPVRKIEIVLGRVLGFTAIGTLLLLGIGVISYGFTVRGVSHTHELTSDMLHKEMLPGNRGFLLVGETSESHGHRHRVTINEMGECTVETKQDHTHDLYITKTDDGETHYRLGTPKGQFEARVPIYGKLSFTDKTGKLKNQARNINVGDEWNYRSFIQGRTSAEAKWVFSDLREDMFPPDQFPQGIPMEMTIEVFRTHKGNMERGVPGTIWLSNPKTGRKVKLEDFAAEKYATDVHMIPLHFSREGRDGRIEEIDLFKDLVSDGQLGISLQCLEFGQNFGMAQPDMYIRAADGSFELNFAKAYLGIWLVMVLVLSLGVMFSTFLSGSVAILATVFALILGLFSSYLVELAGNKMVGGGPWESAERIVTQDNMINQLEPGAKTTAIKALDEATALALRYLTALVPEVNDCFFGRHLAFGFNIGRDLLVRCILRELGFVLPVILLGYICLRQREVAE